METTLVDFAEDPARSSACRRRDSLAGGPLKTGKSPVVGQPTVKKAPPSTQTLVGGRRFLQIADLFTHGFL